MRITTQLLRSRAKKPLHSVEYLDLSSAGIERIEKLGVCSKLRTLSLSDNGIDYVSNLHVCPQLWKLDLSNNVVQSLEGVCRFVALGSLVLSNNQLSWSELGKLRHVHIMDLSLHGNPQLEQDPYYRIHVIDSLPNVWMLDGRVITSAERLQVQHFFQDSALTDHPVRHKCSKEHFTTTQMKNISTNGVFGEKTIHLMRRFPTNGALNVDTDRRRLKYLAYSLQEDLKLEAKYNKRDSRVVTESRTFLEDVLSIRQHDREKANMLLLLLVASLEFAIPIHLMKETLDNTKLSVAGNVHTMELFLLPRDNRCSIVSLLLSAVKVDKDMGEEGGLYDKLYLCLYYSVAELNKLAQASEKTTLKMDKKSQAVYADSRSLIGAEVVQLMCIVPTFFDYVTKDPGVMHLVTSATCDGGIVDRIRRMMAKLEKDTEPQHMCEEVADMILSAIQQNALNMLNRTKTSNANNVDILLNMKKKPLPRRPQSSPIFASEYHAAGRTTPRHRPTAKERLKSAHLRHSPQPQLGDAVLLGPQNVARIISIPEADIVLVQMDVVPAETGAMVSNSKNPDEHYSYLDMHELYWDHLANYWRPMGTVGDRISIQVLDPSESVPPLEGVDGEVVGDQTGCPSSTPSPPCSLRTAVTTPGGLPYTNQHYKKPENVPRAVSAQLKERLNLKLQLSNDVGRTTGREADHGTPSQHPATPNTSPKENGDDGAGSNSHLSENPTKHVTLVAPSPSAQTTVVITVSDLGPESQDAASTLGANTSGSVSLPPATAEAAAGGQEAAVISIDIPQMPQDLESVGGDTTRSVGTRGGMSEDVGDRESFRSAVAKNRESSSRGFHPKGSFAMHTSRPSSVSGSGTGSVGYKMIVAADKHYVSSYQAQRTEAWKNSKLSQPTSSVSPVTVATPSMQQQLVAPSYRGSAEDVTGRQSAGVRYVRGDTWLAGGRDLHWEARVNRPRTAHSPGWKEGLSPRPKSAAAMRALKRNKSPAIMTPSSMAYDMAYGRGVQQLVPDLTPVDYLPPPVQHGVRRLGTTPTPFSSRPSTPQSPDSPPEREWWR